MQNQISLFQSHRNSKVTMDNEQKTFSEPVSADFSVEWVQDRIHTIAEVAVVYATNVIEKY